MVLLNKPSAFTYHIFSPKLSQRQLDSVVVSDVSYSPMDIAKIKRQDSSGCIYVGTISHENLMSFLLQYGYIMIHMYIFAGDIPMQELDR